MVFTIFMNLIACGGDSFDRSSFVLDTKQSKLIIFGGKSKIIDGFKELGKHIFWMYGWIYLHVRITSTFYFKSQFISDTYSDLFHYTYTVTHIDKVPISYWIFFTIPLVSILSSSVVVADLSTSQLSSSSSFSSSFSLSSLSFRWILPFVIFSSCFSSVFSFATWDLLKITINDKESWKDGLEM